MSKALYQGREPLTVEELRALPDRSRIYVKWAGWESPLLYEVRQLQGYGPTAFVVGTDVVVGYVTPVDRAWAWGK